MGQKSTSGRRKSWLLLASISDIHAAEGKRKNMSTGGYFQVNSLPSFHEAGFLCCWNLNSSLVACIPALETQQFSTVGHLTGQELCHILGIFFFAVNMEHFMGSNSSYTYIQYNFWKKKGAEKAKHEIEKSNLWSGESQESDPSVESCFVMLRWKEAAVILCFFPFLLPHMKSSTSSSFRVQGPSLHINFQPSFPTAQEASTIWPVNWMYPDPRMADQSGALSKTWRWPQDSISAKGQQLP